MCTKTKNSYGCGHCAKIFEYCGDRHCEDVAKYAMPAKESDCARCKAGGEGVTRGKEGRGRYGRAIQTRQSSSDSYAPSSPVPVPHMSVSPWAADEHPSTYERKWVKPHRRRADDAWVVEHSRRASDLEELSSKISQDSRSRRGSFSSSRKPSPNSSEERITHIYENDEFADSIADSLEFEGIPRSRGAKHRSDRVTEAELSRSYHSRHSSDRKSHRTVPVFETPSRRQKQLTGAKSEYNAENLQLVHRPRRSATMSDAVASAAQPLPPHPHHVPFHFESPISGSPAMTSGWDTQYQVASNYPPAQYNGYYQRSYVPAVH